MNKNKIKYPRALVHIFLAAIAFVMIFPLIYCILASFKTNMEIMTAPEAVIPKEPTLQNYIDAWNAQTFNAALMFFNSMWYTCVSVVITLISSTVCGYVFARGNFKGKKLIFSVFSAMMFISLGSITIYPTFDVLSLLHLNDSLFGLIVLQCFGIPVVNMYLVRGFINSLPYELDESATLDGCTFSGVLFRVIAPLLRPVLTTITILSFNGTWNSYLMPALFTMTRPKQQTLIVGIMELKNSGEAATAWNLMLAATVIALLPVIVVFILGNKYITEGMVAGAIKG